MLQGKEGGPYTPRLYQRASQGTKSARYLVKCGCCDEQVEIYYDKEELEINGVLASIEDWKSILLPLLVREPN